MIKFTVLVVRRPDITAAQFHRRWLIDHGSLAKRYLLFFVFTVMCKVMSSIRRPLPQSRKIRDWTSNPYDGIVEAWWESEEEMAAGFASKEAQEPAKILAKDEREFCDSGTTVFLAGNMNSSEEMTLNFKRLRILQECLNCSAPIGIAKLGRLRWIHLGTSVTGTLGEILSLLL